MRRTSTSMSTKSESCNSNPRFCGRHLVVAAVNVKVKVVKYSVRLEVKVAGEGLQRGSKPRDPYRQIFVDFPFTIC